MFNPFPSPYGYYQAPNQHILPQQQILDDNMTWAKRYLEMANDELKHADYIHERVVAEIEELRETYTPPQNMLDKWNEDHKKYIEKAAWIRQMLAM